MRENKNNFIKKDPHFLSMHKNKIFQQSERF